MLRKEGGGVERGNGGQSFQQGLEFIHNKNENIQRLGRFSPKCLVSNLLMKNDSRHFLYMVGFCLQFSKTETFMFAILCPGRFK